jgi:hypothetical protein
MSTAPHLRFGPPAHAGTGVVALVDLARRVGAAAFAPLLAPVLEPFWRPVSPLAAALTGSAGRTAGDGPPRPLVALRVDGHDERLHVDVLRRLACDDSGRVLVLVPASGGDERSWRRGVDRTGATYGDRLAALLGWSPLTLRYDAGADLTDAALTLGAMMQRLVETWPVPVTRLVLLTEGDGGLLARQALGLRQPVVRRPWTDLVTELVALGTPALGRLPVADGRDTPRFGRLLEQELAGLVVVGHDALDVPAPGHVAHLLVTDRGVARPNAVGSVLGQVLRWPRRSRRVHDLFPTAERWEVCTHRHPLVNHPEVHEALLRWLA